MHPKMNHQDAPTDRHHSRTLRHPLIVGKTTLCRFSFMVALAGMCVSPLVVSMALGDEPAPAEKFGREGSVKVRIPRNAFSSSLLNGDVRTVADYGSFVIVEAPAGAVPSVSDAQVLADDNYIMLNSGVIDTTQTAAKELQRTRGEFAGKRLHLVQFAGPVRPEWYAQLEQTGASIVTYIPSNAYLVYGDSQQIARVQTLANQAPHVQWNGEYVNAYKIHPNARPEMVALNANQTGHRLYAIQLVLDPVANSDTRAVVDRLKAAPVAHQYDLLEYQNLIVELPPDKVSEIADQPDVVSIHVYNIPKTNDERQDQIVAGNLFGTVPGPPGYLQWLVDNGFSQSQFDASNFSVDVTDSGVDNGTTSPNHFGLYVTGNPSGTSRVIYNRLVGTPAASGSTIQGCDGHGNINAHIIAGYANTAGSTFQDTSGYHYGLGVCPYVKVGSTVIFDFFDGVDEHFTFPNYSTIQSLAYNSGARISSNSWGADISTYTTDSQTYDALVRDAQPTGSAVPVAGNQEMVIVFANGNAGSNPGTVGSPATAKNVISVGAAENVQAIGGNDRCGLGDTFANSINDIAPFSSRGPCADGRKKPDVIAPGIHISGGVAQAASPAATGTAIACFNAFGVCGLAPTVFFPTGQQFYTVSSGTSHSCPAVAGGCAVIRQFFINHGMTPPSPAMTKALLMNSARYIPGPLAGTNLWSDIQGMGEMNLGQAFIRGTSMPSIFVEEDPVNNLFTASGQTRIFTGKVVTSTLPFRVTLAWTDAPGNTTGNAYKNDLDLTLTVDGNTYKGNVFTGAFSVPGGAVDTRNNVESVFVFAAPTGSPFTVTVTATNINSNGVPNLGTSTDQDFALIMANAFSCPTISAGPSTLPGGTTGTAYSQTLTAAGGSNPYVWTLDSGSLPPGLTLSAGGVLSGTPATVGTYTFSVRATDTNGCAVTKSYSLIINCRLVGDIVITKQPAKVVTCSGGPATFEVDLNSPTALLFQWRKDGKNIPNATQQSLTIDSVTDADVGDYDVVIYNECSQSKSESASLEIAYPMVVGSPDAIVSKTCDAITFSVEVSGLGPYTYQWRRDGETLTDDDRIKGSQSVILSISPLSRNDIGSYDVVVTTRCGVIISKPAVLNVQGLVNLNDCPNASGNSALGVGSIPCAQCGTGMSLSTMFAVAGWGWWRRRSKIRR